MAGHVNFAITEMRKRKLGLALTITAGGDFYVDGKRFVVSRIESATAFTITREMDGAEFEVVDDGLGCEIAPQVMASVNLGGGRSAARLNLTAPRSVVLATGKNYRRHPADP